MPQRRASWSITDWLERDQPPGNVYELLGTRLFNPDTAVLNARIQSGSRELVTWQNHNDRQVVQRVIRLQVELGNASKIVSSAERLDAHHHQIIESLRTEFNAQHDGEAGPAESERLHDWLVSCGRVHPSAVDDVAARVLAAPEETAEIYSFIEEIEDVEEVSWFIDTDVQAQEQVSRYTARRGMPDWWRNWEPVVLAVVPIILALCLGLYLRFGGSSEPVNALDQDRPTMAQPGKSPIER